MAFIKRGDEQPISIIKPVDTDDVSTKQKLDDLKSEIKESKNNLNEEQK